MKKRQESNKKKAGNSMGLRLKCLISTLAAFCRFDFGKAADAPCARTCPQKKPTGVMKNTPRTKKRKNRKETTTRSSQENDTGYFPPTPMR